MSKDQLLRSAAPQEPDGPVLSGDDFRAAGELEVGLAGVALPDAVAGANRGRLRARIGQR